MYSFKSIDILFTFLYNEAQIKPRGFSYISFLWSTSKVQRLMFQKQIKETSNNNKIYSFFERYFAENQYLASIWNYEFNYA